MLMPSISIEPSVASTKRKKESASVDFPEPVRPTSAMNIDQAEQVSASSSPKMPIFSPGWILKFRPCSTLGSSGCRRSDSLFTLRQRENTHCIAD
jgi:hypothetical protein